MEIDNRSTWEKIYQEQEWGKYPAEALIRFIARNFYQRKRDEVHILEVGCGPGPNIWYFAREGFNAYGIDISETAIERAKNRLVSEGLSAVELRAGNILSLPFSDKTFDCVVDNACLYCNSLSDTEMIMKEIQRVTKDEGFLYSRTPSSDMYIGKAQKKRGHLEFYDISDGPFAGKGLARLIDRQGINALYGRFFEIISVDRMDYTSNNGEIKVSEWVIICRNNTPIK